MHLHCPSFHIADPRSEECFDESSPSIKQLQLIGFSSENALFFDHPCRREVHRRGAIGGIREYLKEVLDVHEAFMLNVRDEMVAAVEICFGKHVQDRMKSLFQLEPFPLWGRYQGVTLWLEWISTSENRRLERILLFVMHPNAMLYIDRNGPQWRTYELSLRAAAQMAGITIVEDICAKKLCRPENSRLNQVQKWAKNELNELAEQELRAQGVLKDKKPPLQLAGKTSVKIARGLAISPELPFHAQNLISETHKDVRSTKRKFSDISDAYGTQVIRELNPHHRDSPMGRSVEGDDIVVDSEVELG